MKLVDLMSVEGWKALEDALQKHCGMNVHVYDTEGNYITGEGVWASDLCPEVRSSREGLMNVCAIAHQNVAAMARKSKAPALFECDAGLVKFVVPIFNGDEYLGTLGGCGFRNPDVDVETSLLHDITGIDLEKLQHLASGVKTIDEDKVDELMQYFQESLDRALSS